MSDEQEVGCNAIAKNALPPTRHASCVTHRDSPSLHASRVPRLALLLATATLSSCATRPTPAPTHEPAQLTSWQANGRIAVAGPEGGGSGSFTWRQSGIDGAVNIRGPIGIGSLQITLSGNQVRVATGDGQEFEAAAAQDELSARLGASVPTSELRYWMVGLAAPGEHEWSQGGDATVLLQREWRIEYQRYQVESGYKLPTRFVATSGPARVRVVIDKWKPQ